LEMLTLAEVGHLLRMSEQTVRNRLSLGLPMPPSFRIGRRRLFRRDDFDRWLDDRSRNRHGNSEDS
jgi:predicted DNA-binding transcriptional regulator AlpA